MRAVWICRSREYQFKRVRLIRFCSKITIEYKIAETENVDLDLFVVRYLSPEEIISTLAFARAIGILAYSLAGLCKAET